MSLIKKKKKSAPKKEVVKEVKEVKEEVKEEKKLGGSAALAQKIKELMRK